MAPHQLVALDQAATQLRETDLAWDDATGQLLLAAAPTLPASLANKEYVDGELGANFVKKAGDAMTGPLVLAGDPTLALHAAPRQYVDAVRTDLGALIAANANALAALADDTYSMGEIDTGFYAKAAADAKFVDVAGDTMTGPLVLAGDPAAPLDAATKGYVDAVAAGEAGGSYVLKAGDTMTGPLLLTGTGVQLQLGVASTGLRRSSDGTAVVVVLDNSPIAQFKTGAIDPVNDPARILRVAESEFRYVGKTGAQEMEGPLTVAGAVTAGGHVAAGNRLLLAETTGANGYCQIYRPDGTACAQFIHINANDDVRVCCLNDDGATVASAVILKQNGQVQLGATGNPTAVVIQADNTIRALPTYNNTGAAPTNMTINAAGVIFRSTSSGAFKVERDAVTDGLELVLALRPITYRSTHETDIGMHRLMEFVAEDVFAAIPEAEADGGSNYDVRAVVAAVVSAVQELASRVAILEAAA